MNHTWENDEKPNFEPEFDLFGPNLMLGIVASYYLIKFQGKLMNRKN